MEKKKKINGTIMFLILTIFIIIGMAYFIYELKKEDNVEVLLQSGTTEHIVDEKENDTTVLQLGTYQITEHIVDSAGVSYDDVGVTLTENSLCSVYAGWGSSYLGTYTVENNKLICNTIINRGESGGILYSEGNIVFEFEIINNNQIKFVSVLNNSDMTYDSTALKEGMTYKLTDAQIKVLVD